MHSQKSERADTFLDTIGEREENFWLAHVLLLGRNITFKLDTGAEVTAISFEAWKVYFYLRQIVKDSVWAR